MKTPRDLPTPSLLLDQRLMRANIARMLEKLAKWDIPIRLHCKTCKSVEAALCCQTDRKAPIAVATLAEAEYFANAGFTDILYAVGIAPAKLPRVLDLRQKGCALKIITDNMDAARAVASFGKIHSFDVMLEIDCDGHRGGLLPQAPELVEIADILAENGQNVAGVLTHAGSAYELAQPSPEAFRSLAAQEAASARRAAARLRNAGHVCPIVSVGSTPTALFGEDFGGITEMRAGVFIFQDCVQAALGVCQPEEIALSVLCSVIGRRQDDALVVDAGWTALSQDRGADFGQYGYGLVADMNGRIIPGLRVCDLNQEHGIVASASGNTPALRPGRLLRILPVHACAVANAFSCYNILENNKITAIWQKCRGW